MNFGIDRRVFLQSLVAAPYLTIPGWIQQGESIWVPTELPATPSQMAGPFYPDPTIEQQLYNDNDLRQKLGDHEFAKGQPIQIRGSVKDPAGKPVPAAVVEIWQACAAGRYDHKRDNGREKDGARRRLDNNFQFWGRAITGEQGDYQFLTIIPGTYTDRSARHIHFRIDSQNHTRLTTQCYFSEFGEDNAKDWMYKRLDRKQRELLTIEFEKPETSDYWHGQFDVVLPRA